MPKYVQAGVQEADHHGQAEEHLHEAAGCVETAVGREGGAGGSEQTGAEEAGAQGAGGEPV